MSSKVPPKAAPKKPATSKKTTAKAEIAKPAAAKAAVPKPAKEKGGATAKVMPTTAPAVAPPQPVAKPAAPSAPPKKLGCLDAAAKVLAEATGPLSSKELIIQMAEKQLWSSPAGQTPHATLYSAIGREIRAKGKESRFVKADKGKFAANKTVAAL